MKRLIQVIVVAAIKQNNRYLLTKRFDPENKLTHNRWQMPGGGLEFNETIIQCLHREVKEETGLRVKIIAFIPRIHEKIFPKSGWHGVAAGFVCEPIEKTPQVKLDKEASDYRWFLYKELKDLPLHHGTRDLINYAEKISVGERT